MNENAIEGRAASTETQRSEGAAAGAVSAAIDSTAAASGATTITGQAADAVLAAIRFDPNGLVPAIAQQHDTGEVLMMAWMNAEAVRETLATGRVCYFSRSRGRLWRKGETSGQSQHLKEMRVDCDGDTLLVLVQQDGVACHTGRRSCFFRAARGGRLVEIASPERAPETLYGHLHG